MKYLLSIFILLFLAAPVSAGWDHEYTPNELTNWTHISAGGTGTYTLENDGLTMTGGQYVMTGIRLNTTDQYYRIEYSGTYNSYSENVFPTISFLVGSDDTLNHTNSNGPYMFQNGYTIQPGDKVAAGSYFKFYVNGTATGSAIDIDSSENHIIEFYIKDGYAVTVVDGTERFNTTSVGTPTALIITEYDTSATTTAKLHVYGVDTATSYFDALSIESTPASDPTTYNFQNSPTFTITGNQVCNISWYLDTVEQTADSSTSLSSTFIPDSHETGTYNVTGIATCENGTESETWAWEVISPASTAPYINLSSASTLTQYENLGIDFSVDLIDENGELYVTSPGTWSVDSVEKQVDETSVTHTYTLPGDLLSAGDHTVTFTATNGGGTVIETWDITYLENSMTVLINSYDTLPNVDLLNFTVSEFTPGITGHGWHPTFSNTTAGKSYSWVNDSTILSTKTASSDGETLTFDTVDTPEGTYRIGVVPEAAFSGIPTSGTVNTFIVTFTDSSLYADSWAWDFENDGHVDNTDQDPTHAYTISGTYSVNLTASNDYGSDSELKAAYILVSPNEGIDPFNWFYWWMRSHWRW